MSFDLHQLLLVFTVYIVGAASPGPTNMRIMGVAMHQGRKPALLMAAGVITGSFFWGSIAATGVSAILAQFAQALIAIKIFGGFYLIYLAIKACRSAIASDKRIEQMLAAAPAVSGFSLYRRGLLFHMTNPKALLGWIATMTLGLGAEATPTTLAISLAGCAVLSITIFGGYAIVFSTAPMIRGYNNARRWIEGTLSLVFGVAGIKLLLSRS